MRRILLSLMLLASITPAIYCEELAAPNAALRYWQAFIRVASIPKNDSDVIYKGNAADDARTRVFNTPKVLIAMRELHRGAALAACDWGTEWQTHDQYSDEEHFSRVRSLARVARFCAQEHFRQKRFTESVDCLIDMFILSRHMGMDGSTMARLIQESIEGMAAATAANEVPFLPKAELERLLTQLEHLPPGGKCSAATIKQHHDVKQYVSTMATRTIEEIRDEAKQMNADETRLERLRGDPQALAAELAETDALIDEAGLLLDLPFAEYEKAKSEFETKHKLGFFASASIPSLFVARRTLESMACEMAVLKAGIQMALHGEKDAANTKDPYSEGGEKPFSFFKVPEGYELSSVFKNRRPELITLRFAPPPPPMDDTARPRRPVNENQGEF